MTPILGNLVTLENTADPTLFVGGNAATRVVPSNADGTVRPAAEVPNQAVVEVTGNSARFTPVFAAQLAHSGTDVNNDNLWIDNGDQTAPPAAIDSTPANEQASSRSTGRMSSSLAIVERVRSASDSCFVGEQWLVASAEQGPAPLVDTLGPAPNYLAALAGMAVVLSGYWGNSGSATTRQQRSPSLTKIV
jgi:hypothetical protein